VNEYLLFNVYQLMSVQVYKSSDTLIWHSAIYTKGFSCQMNQTVPYGVLLPGVGIVTFSAHNVRFDTNYWGAHSMAGPTHTQYWVDPGPP
jgi:hypothetical protein